MITRNLSILLTAFACSPVFSSVLPETIDADISAVESKVIQWRRHFHQHPELSNRELLFTGLSLSYIITFIIYLL